MESPIDYNLRLDNKVIKPTAGRKAQRIYFYDGSRNYANINLNPEFIQKLHLAEFDEVTEEIIETSDGKRGILILPNHSNNKSAGGYQANPADDDSTATYPDVQNHE